MRFLVFSFFISFIFLGCGFKEVKNKWKYDSASSFESYMDYFFVDDMVLANSYLKSSIKYAKQSADLSQLASIYLGVCSLNRSVGIEDSCKDYIKLSNLNQSRSLESYYLMLENGIKDKELQYLPKQYQSFSQNLILKNYNLAFEDIKSMKQISSKFIAAGLIKEKLNKKQIEYLIDTASFYGYKKLVLYWLKCLYKIENNQNKKDQIDKKIQILTS